jgi:hypothetical protein
LRSGLGYFLSSFDWISKKVINGGEINKLFVCMEKGRKSNKIKCLFFFFDNLGCPSQFTHTTINSRIHWTSCKFNRHVRHRRDDRRTHKGSNPKHIDRTKPTKTTELQALVYSKCLFSWRRDGGDEKDTIGFFKRKKILK